METSLLFSFISLAIGSALLSSFVSLGADRLPILLRGLAFLLLAISGLSAVISGGWVLLNNLVITAQVPLGLPWLPWHLRLDPLSGFFFIITGLITFAVSCYGPGYVGEMVKSAYSLARLGFFTGLFITGMLLVLLADDLFMFMFAWELMSLSSYFLVIYHYSYTSHRRAAFLYLLMAQISALAIVLAFGILAGVSDNLSFTAIRNHLEPLSFTWATITFSLGLLGFGMKAGLIPMHTWLPEAHPIAPTHISVLMSSVMLKVAIYGLIRLVFDLLGEPHWSWGVTLLLIGAATGLMGILYALVQNDLKRLLAYSSIENIGIICMSLGLSLLFIAQEQWLIGALGLIAALYHALNHALFKGLLFFGAGAIVHSTQARNLEEMGGLIRYLPYTAFFFLIGCLSIAGLPPLNGFVSEWLTFQTALQTPSLEGGVLRAIIPISAALLALTTALSATCFVKAYGIAFLGQPRQPPVTSQPIDFGMLTAQALLAGACLLLGILPTAVVSVLTTIPQHLIGHGLPSASQQGWLWLTPISNEVASYSAPLVILAMVTVAGLVFLWLITTKKTRRTAAWDCGFGTLNARMQYTATAFAMPLRHIFAPTWRIAEQLKKPINDKTLMPNSIQHELQMGDRFWPLLYEPVINWIAYIARQIGRIQTGQIRTYLAYSFFTLLVLLWLIT
jgi:hydrogenase-4 component B